MEPSEYKHFVVVYASDRRIFGLTDSIVRKNQAVRLNSLDYRLEIDEHTLGNAMGRIIIASKIIPRFDETFIPVLIELFNNPFYRRELRQGELGSNVIDETNFEDLTDCLEGRLKEAYVRMVSQPAEAVH